MTGNVSLRRSKSMLSILFIIMPILNYKSNFILRESIVWKPFVEKDVMKDMAAVRLVLTT